MADSFLKVAMIVGEAAFYADPATSGRTLLL